ncbi:MAG: bifunctional (p)ppGpp synthetase/guanosine-3',5'-bis(diphosphate) 3'-pyrophosphohydrolase [Candidatus Magasanikbacteria bacterium]|nr:bifunctional (p)ppGpp synthetase/guanosine-3',5'-bis(diphosphate) 3'-pyrophosphohydrolase [Candidatus Magasanikbacteria bacterium]
MNMETIENLLKIVKNYNPKADLDLIRLAYDFAEQAHQGQKRLSGIPYIEHPLNVAVTLAEMKLDTAIIVAGLLHDIPEDTAITLNEIKKNFGADVASMVEGVTKLGKLKYRGVERYIENLRKMFVSIAKDIRVIIIKFADRLHNLKTLDALPEKKRQRVALESLEIYAPIANRLGMGEMKGQIEDYSFKHLNAKEYNWITEIMTESYQQRKQWLDTIKKITQKELQHSHIEIVSMHGRVKHTYSLFCKILRYNRDINKIYDLVALRVIVKDLADCYATLGVIHKLWRPVPSRIKDYISQPKPNGYQSIHTTVFAADGQIVEFQIRTEKMHEEAEFGVAAHWHYDEKGSAIPSKNIAWVKELAAFQKVSLQKLTDLEDLKIDVFQNRIFVFTPRGDVIDLPERASPVDFAYSIHTELGNKCVGARINDQLASLDTSLKSGDVVEILTDKNRKGPSLEWLKFVKTNAARGHIKAKAHSSLTDWLKTKILPEKFPKKEADKIRKKKLF